MNMNGVYSLFVRSGLFHEGGIPDIKDCFALLSVTLNQQRVFQVLEKNFAGKHVEERLIHSLREYFIQRPRQLETSKSVHDTHVEIMINFSPCYDCSDRFVQFIDEMRQAGILLSMEIVFPFLYKVRRPWCERNCPNEPLPSINDHVRSVNGLLKLKGKGIRLRPFEKSDWIRLADILNVPRFVYDIYGNARENEDRRMKYNCHALGLTEGAGFGGASTLLGEPVYYSFARGLPAFGSDVSAVYQRNGSGFNSFPSFSFVPGDANTFSSVPASLLAARPWSGTAVQIATTALYTAISNTEPRIPPAIAYNAATMYVLLSAFRLCMTPCYQKR